MTTQPTQLKQFTSQDVIQIIFWNNAEERDRVLNEFKSADEAEKYDKAVILWEQYNRLKQAYAALIFEKLTQDARNGTLKNTTDILSQARIQAHKDFERMLTGEHKDDAEIEAIRERLQSMALAK